MCLPAKLKLLEEELPVGWNFEAELGWLGGRGYLSALCVKPDLYNLKDRRLICGRFLQDAKIYPKEDLDGLKSYI